MGAKPSKWTDGNIYSHTRNCAIERLRNMYIVSCLKILVKHIHSMQFPCITYGIWRYKRQNTDKTLTSRKSIYASELRKYLPFHILKMLFLVIFCWYFKYFVGTNGMHASRLTKSCNDKFPNVTKNKYEAIAPMPPPPPYQFLYPVKA